MQGDAKVIEYLNKGLRHELTAINQYWLHFRLLHNWGLLELAKQWRKESIEEMHHADRFTDRIIFLDGFPNMQVLDPLRIGQNVKEIIECDLASEVSARSLYEEAATHCHGVKDYVSRDLFESLMKDEEHHIDFLETQLDLVGRIGLELYTQKHVGGLESERASVWADPSLTTFRHGLTQRSSFRDAPLGADPESITPIVVMDSGLARCTRDPE
jgi:bacterioferritin